MSAISEARSEVDNLENVWSEQDTDVYIWPHSHVTETRAEHATSGHMPVWQAAPQIWPHDDLGTWQGWLHLLLLHSAVSIMTDSGALVLATL